MEVDPDYAYDISQDSIEEADITKQLEEHAREAVKEKIRSIIKKQFAYEIEAKEKEVALIAERLTEARHMLDRLRACVVASYYASSFAKPQEKRALEPGAAQHPAIQNILRKAATAVLSRNAPPRGHTKPTEKENDVGNDNTEPESDGVVESESKPTDNTSLANELIGREDESENAAEPLSRDTPKKEQLGGRHRVRKTIIVGNVSKYIPPDMREGNDKSTHKWMVYVRGPADEPRIDHFVRKVWFFLHPSYRPNDLVEISEAPFHLTRRGWGEFPIRVQLHFCDPRNRRVDIIHNLSLDRTYTGLQTLGSETVCEVELDRSTVGLTVENLLSNPVEMPSDDVETPEDGARELVSVSNEDEEENEAISASGDHQVARDLLHSLVSRVDAIISGSTLDGDSPEADDPDLSTGTERRRRRRRGDSCTVPDPSESQSKQSVPMMVVCPDEDMEEDEEEMVIGASEQLCNLDDESKSPGLSPDKTTSTQEDTVYDIGESVDVQSLKLAVESNVESPVKSAPVSATSGNQAPDSTVGGEVGFSTSISQPPTPSDIRPTSPNQSQEPPPLPDRPRSLSVDSVTPLPLTGSKLGSRLSALCKEASLNKPSSPVVLLRPRSSSTFSQQVAQTAKGNVTILTPVTVRGGKSPSAAGQKRTIGRIATTPSGKILLNLVPTKQRRTTLGAVASKADDVTVAALKNNPDPTSGQQTSVKVIQTAPGIKYRSSSLPAAGDAVLHPGYSGTLQAGSKVKVESAPAKSYVLKNTKHGICIVGQDVLAKESAPLNTTGLRIKSTGTSTKQHQLVDLSSNNLPIAVSDDPKQPKRSSDPKTTTQQQVVTLRAVKSSAQSSGTSRPVQIKIEKSASNQVFNQLKQHQQFVLTTITTDQGKQQLALVNADRLKQNAKTKNLAFTSQVSPSDSERTSFPIKMESVHQSPASWIASVAASNIIVPFHVVVANRILACSINDLTRDALPLAVKYVPLVSRDRDIASLPFCARTEAEFLDWNVGKQRAAELQRSSLIQKALKNARERCDRLKTCKVPSKRFIANWCLTRGYSIFTDEYETVQEHVDDKVEVKVESSLSSHHHLLDQLVKKSNPKPRKRDEEENETLDVVSVSPPRESDKSELRPLDGDGERSRICFIYSEPMKAVDKMTQDIGVKLKNVTLDDDVSAPLTHVILAKALEIFTCRLARESLATAIMRRDGDGRPQRVLPEMIASRDVADAVARADECLLMTDQHMGMPSSSS